MNDNINQPRILIISFNCLLSSNANGRTLINLMDGYDSEKLAQIYMSSDIPDYSGCSRYYRITDSDAFHSFFHKTVGGPVSAKKFADLKENKSINSENSSFYSRVKSRRKNPLLRYLREIIWECGRWESQDLYQWIDDFKPEIILLFSGNNSFVDKFSYKVSERYKIPIVLYNCEDYYLKPKNYRSPFSIIYKKHNDKIFEKTMSIVAGVIYNTYKLQKSYGECFPDHKSIVLLNPASDVFCRKQTIEIGMHNSDVVYLGNVTVGREEVLCKIADTLSKYGYKLNLYGRCNSQSALDIIKSNENIIYHGVVSYDECCRIMMESLLLVHCENFSRKHQTDLKHAFSTKIADSLASGTCLFVFAPKNIAVMEYLIENEAACVATTEEEMDQKLSELLHDSNYRLRFVKKAREIYSKNHKKEKTGKDFSNFMIDIVNIH